MQNSTDSIFDSPVVTPRQVLTRARRLIAESQPALTGNEVTYKAALILLLGDAVRFNVDRIARLTGYDRTFVARAVRRLIDNGVWSNGETSREWSDGELTASFWRDVAVAEGHLYRRRSESGELEWGFPGSWWKAFDFGDTSQGSSSAVRYSYAVEEQERETCRPLEDVVEADEVEEVVVPAPVMGLWDDEPSWSLGVSSSYGSKGSSDAPSVREDEVAVGAGGAEGSDLFPDAVWLG